ncbi:hypothetical protein [Alienimonas sp. DA493]|uniref:hypothetical protein n=1 Tax=Alienimonas sp. DA493 TaxID=3373605 RepID=UPI003754F137
MTLSAIRRQCEGGLIPRATIVDEPSIYPVVKVVLESATDADHCCLHRYFPLHRPSGGVDWQWSSDAKGTMAECLSALSKTYAGDLEHAEKFGAA